MKVIKAFMKTKKKGENIYKMINAWLRNCSFVVFMKKEIKYTKRERDRKESAWRLVEQFLIVFS